MAPSNNFKPGVGPGPQGQRSSAALAVVPSISLMIEGVLEMRFLDLYGIGRRPLNKTNKEPDPLYSWGESFA